MSQQILTVGLVINPWAGVGGAVGLKGSDGVIAEALARGAEPKANLRVRTALESLLPYSDRLRFISADGAMGSDLLAKMGFTYTTLDSLPVTDTSAIIASATSPAVDSNDPSKKFSITTSAEDTRHAAQQLVDTGVDILLFAGGDGTARDICAVVGEQCPVLGIPAGVKIHSSVFGITPTACGDVLEAFLRGQLVDIREAEVRDLDEEAFRNDRVQARYFGELRVPQLGHFVQSVKQGGVEDESLVMLDIAATLQQEWEDDTLYLIGSGKTTQALMDEMVLPSTLLGVDAVFNYQVLHADCSEQTIWELLQQHTRVKLIISVMGGQGHIIGRGNQQLSPRNLQKIGKSNITVVSTKTKILALEGRPLIMDSGDVELDRRWAGSIEIVTGYQDSIVYPLI